MGTAPEASSVIYTHTLIHSEISVEERGLFSIQHARTRAGTLVKRVLEQRH